MKEAVLQTTTEIDLENASIGDFIRMGVAAEESAITLYNRIADQLNALGYGKPGNVFRDIAQEEKVHIGEFQALLNQYEKENQQAEKEGASEVEEILKENLGGFFDQVKKKLDKDRYKRKLSNEELLAYVKKTLKEYDIPYTHIMYNEAEKMFDVISPESSTSSSAFCENWYKVHAIFDQVLKLWGPKRREGDYWVDYATSEYEQDPNEDYSKYIKIDGPGKNDPVTEKTELEPLTEFFEGINLEEDKVSSLVPELENILRKNNISFDRIEYDESGYTVVSSEFDLPDWEPFEEEERKFISLFPFGDFHGHNIFLVGVDF